MEYETQVELRNALARRIGRAIDAASWEAIAPEWSPPYDNADLTELVGRWSSMGRPGRQQRTSKDWRAQFDSVPRTSLEEDAQRARERLGMDQDLATGRSLHPRLVLFRLLEKWLVLFTFADDVEEKQELREGALVLLWWWGCFVRELALLALVHGISDRHAFELLTGYPWGRAWKRQRLIDELHALPKVLLANARMPRVLQEQEVARLLNGPRYRRILLEVFLDALGWRPGSGPPLGSWEDARKTYNSLLRDKGPEVLFDSTEAFRKAVCRTAPRRALDPSPPK